MQHIPCALILTGFRALLVHAGPRHLAAAHIDGVARRNGDGLRPLIEADTLCIAGHLLVQEDLRQIVLVGGGGRQLQVGALAVDGQRVLVGITGLAGDKPGQQLAALNVQRRKGGVGVVPSAVQIHTQIAGVHDPDHIAVLQLAVGHGELAEAIVGEPVVQRAHPTGIAAAVKLSQLEAVHGDRGNIVALRTGLRIALLLQGLHHAGHHGTVGSHLHLGVGGLAVPIGLTAPIGLGKCGVLHDDPHGAVAGGGGLHVLHRGLIGLVHGSGGLGGGDGARTVLIGRLGLVAQAAAQLLQAAQRGLLDRAQRIAHRRPGDGHRHVVIGHGERLIGVRNIHVDNVGALALIAGIVVDPLRFHSDVRRGDTVKRNALDPVDHAVDGHRQVSRGAVFAGLVVRALKYQVKAQALVADAPISAIHGKRTICVAGLEVRRVIDSGIEPHRRQRFDFAECLAEEHGSAIITSECIRRHDVDGLCVVILTALCAVHLGRILPQIRHHRAQRGGGLGGVGHHVQLQVVLLVCGEGLVGVGKGLDLVILGLFRAGQLLALIVAHAPVAADQLVHGGLDAGGQQRGIVRQLAQRRAEVGQGLLILRRGGVLIALDLADGALLGVIRLADGGICAGQNLGGLVIGGLQLFPCLGAEIALGIGLVHLVQLGLQVGLDARAVLVGGHGQLQIGGRRHRGGIVAGVAVVGVGLEGRHQIDALVIQLEAGLTRGVRQLAGQDGLFGIGAVLVPGAVHGDLRAGVGAVNAVIGPQVGGGGLHRHGGLHAGLCRLGRRAAKAHDLQLVAQRYPVGGVTVDIVELKAGPVHVDKLHHIAVPQHIACVRNIGFRMYNTIQHHAVDEKLILAVMHTLEIAGAAARLIGIACLAQQVAYGGAAGQRHGLGAGLVACRVGLLAVGHTQVIVVGVDQRHRDPLRRRGQAVDGLQQVLRHLAVLLHTGDAAVALLCGGILGEVILRRVPRGHKGIPAVLRIHPVVGRHGVLLQQGIDGLLVLLRQTEPRYVDQSSGHRRGIVVRLALVLRHILRRGDPLFVEQGIQIGLRLRQLCLEFNDAVLGKILFQILVIPAHALQALIQLRGVQLRGGDQVGDGGLQGGDSSGDLRLGSGGVQHLLRLRARAAHRGELRPEALLTGGFRLGVIAVAGLIPILLVFTRHGGQQVGEGLLLFVGKGSYRLPLNNQYTVDARNSSFGQGSRTSCDNKKRRLISITAQFRRYRIVKCKSII